MAVSIDQSTGCLSIDGSKVFPIALSNPPPLGGKTPSGTDGWAEVASAGVNFIRTRLVQWDLQQIDAQIAQEKTILDAAAAKGFHCWLQLGAIANLPATSGSVNEQLLTRIANGLKSHAALGVYKGVDEPANPNQPSTVPAAGLVRAYQKLKALDPDHPVVITQAPLGTPASLTPYRPAFDITGADIYPVSYPPGVHSDLPNKDISVVGDMTRKMVTAAGGKSVWMTLQIAWSGAIQNQTLYVIAVRRDPTTTNKVAFGGLPTTVSRGEVLFEYVQKPLSPPIDPTKQAFRVITVTNGGFQDWFGPHDARVYRFTLV